MLEYIATIVIGLIGGASVGIQSPIAGAMGQRVGATSSSFIVHAGGMILSGVVLLLRGGEKMHDWATLPWYMLGVGAFGLILYQTMNITLPRLGSTMMVTLIITGQLLAGMAFDHFGWLGVPVRPIDATRTAGVLVLLLGGYLIAK
ncbi:MAG: DMT family transporter [Anaerolineae bacterium]|jgi:transporter family-2 protein|nr:DMT family transporter [Anaerolineae bacterium]